MNDVDTNASLRIIPLKDPLEKYNIRRFYNCVTSQTLSSSGNYLFAGNNFGDIFVFNISNLQDASEEPHGPQIYPQGENMEINCLSFHKDFLVVGTAGVIYGLKWIEETAELGNVKAWKISIPLVSNRKEVPDVNCMWLQQDTDHLFAGCEDNAIYEINLENGSILRDYRDHDDYIHSVCGTEHSRLYSASEDGTVRFWCTNEKKPVHILKPSTYENLVRPEMGKWIGAVTTNGDWLACGGGPKLSLWHLSSLRSTCQYPFPGKIHVCDFIEDSIFVGGESANVQFYMLNGSVTADMKTQNTAVYSAVWQLKPQRFMSVAGFSNELSILNDFRFVDSNIELYKKKCR